MPVTVPHDLVLDVYSRPFYQATKQQGIQRRFALACMLTTAILVRLGRVASIADEVDLDYREFCKLVDPNQRKISFDFNTAREKQELVRNLVLSIETASGHIFATYKVVGGKQHAEKRIVWQFEKFGAELTEKLSGFIFHASGVVLHASGLLMLLAELLHRAVEAAPERADDRRYVLQIPRGRLAKLLDVDWQSDRGRNNFKRDLKYIRDALRRSKLFDINKFEYERNDTDTCTIQFELLPEYKEPQRLKQSRLETSDMAQQLTDQPVPQSADSSEALPTVDPRVEVTQNANQISALGPETAQSSEETVQASEQTPQSSMDEPHDTSPPTIEEILAPNPHNTIATSSSDLVPENLAIARVTEFLSLISRIRETENLLRIHDREINRQLDSSTARELHELMSGELEKLRENLVLIVLFGTTKAGKSTTGNAIVGTAVAPVRASPMTALPTIIRHVPGQYEPLLRFPLRQEFEALAHKVRGRIKEANDANINLETEMYDVASLISRLGDGEFDVWPEVAEGSENIGDLLLRANDLCRLALQVGVELTLSRDLIPTIQVAFEHVSDSFDSPNEAAIALLDTPGVNEAYVGKQMRKQVHALLEQASACVLVCDFTQLGVEAQEEVKRIVSGMPDGLADRSFVFVNKVDQGSEGDLDVDDLRRRLSASFPGGKVRPDRIKPVSALEAFLANWARREIAAKGRLSLRNGNTGEFAKLALGVIWEPEEIDDTEKLNRKADKLWERSRFSEALQSTVQFAKDNGRLLNIESATNKLLHYSERINDFLKMRGGLAARDQQELDRIIRELERDIEDVDDAKNKTDKWLSNSFEELKVKSLEGLKKTKIEVDEVVETYFSTGRFPGFNLIRGVVLTVTDLIKALYEAPTEVDGDFEPNDVLRFSGRNHEVEAAAKLEEIRTKLQKVFIVAMSDAVEQVNRHVESLKCELEREIPRQLGRTLEKAAERLQDTCDVDFFPPKPDFGEGDSFGTFPDFTVELERTVKWSPAPGFIAWILRWTGFSRGYKFSEEHSSLIQLGSLQAEAHDSVGKLYEWLLDAILGYHLNDLKPKIDEYFGRIRSYLDAFKNDLVDASHDTQLKADEYKRLLATIGELQGELDEMRSSSFEINEDVKAELGARRLAGSPEPASPIL
jgi:hypothetical protein